MEDDKPHDSMQPKVLALVVLFPILSTIVVGLRVWQRLWMKQFKADDWLILLALALAIAQAGVVYEWVKVNRFGFHVYDIPEKSTETSVYAEKLDMAQQLLYNPILCIVKASVLLFLMRLDDKRPTIVWSLRVFWWFNLGHMVAVFFAALTQCLPIHMYWDHYYTDRVVDGVTVNDNYTCFDMMSFSLTTAGLAVLTDILILSIPIAMMWNLRMPLRQKLAVGLVLSLGWVVVVIGAIRIKIFYDYWAGTSDDPTYGLSQAVSGIESNVAIITACGPSLKALITRFAPRFFGSSRHTSRPTGNVYDSSQGYEMGTGRGNRSRPSGRGTQYRSFVPSASRQEKTDIDSDSQEAIVRRPGSRATNRSEADLVSEEEAYMENGRKSVGKTGVAM